MSSQDFTVAVADDVTAESASSKKEAGGGISREAIISLSVTFSVLLLLLIGVAIVLMRLNKDKKVLLPQSRQPRRGKTSGVDRSSGAERGSRADRDSSGEQQRGSQSLKSSHATEQRSQAPQRKDNNSSEGNPDEPRITVNVSNELNGTISCASPALPAPMSPPSAPERAPQVCRHKMLRSSSSSGVGSGGGSSLHRQLLAAPPQDAASPRRRCRSADAPAEQPQ